MPADDLNEHELEEFCKSAKYAYEAHVNLLWELSTIDPTTITFPCSRARALSYLAGVKRYFKNTGIKWTIESFLDSSATIAPTKETLKLTQPVLELEALIVASERKMVNQKEDGEPKVRTWQDFLFGELCRCKDRGISGTLPLY